MAGHFLRFGDGAAGQCFVVILHFDIGDAVPPGPGIVNLHGNAVVVRFRPFRLEFRLLGTFPMYPEAGVNGSKGLSEVPVGEQGGDFRSFHRLLYGVHQLNLLRGRDHPVLTGAGQLLQFRLVGRLTGGDHLPDGRELFEVLFPPETAVTQPEPVSFGQADGQAPVRPPGGIGFPFFQP